MVLTIHYSRGEGEKERWREGGREVGSRRGREEVGERGREGGRRGTNRPPGFSAVK